MSPSIAPAFLTTSEAASTLRLKPKVVAKYVRNGTLPAYRLGRKYLLKLSDVVAYIDRNAVTA